MPDIMLLMRVAANAFSTIFGSLGVFFTYFSFKIPNMGAQAILFLSIATAIVWSTDNRETRK